MQYILQPEVPGELGEKTIMDTTVFPPQIHYLHFTFYGWLGDELIECFPCFFIADRIKEMLCRDKLKGFSFSECEIDVSEQFTLLQPQTVLPVFHWFKVTNNENDDFFINKSLQLQVSERAWAILKMANLSHCDISIQQ